MLCGGDGVVSTGTGLLSIGIGVRWGVASSLSNRVGVQYVRVWVMCGGVVPGQVQLWFYLQP